MGERYPSPKQSTGSWESIAHIAEEEQLGRWNTIGVRCNPTLAYVNSPIRKELAQMIVGPAVAEPEFEYLSVQLLDQKMAHIAATGAQAVVAPNPGCSMQLAYGARRKGMPLQQLHVVDLLDKAYGG